jgi:hypothetical protein
MNTEQLENELQSLKERIAELEKQCEAASDSPTWANVAVGKEGWYVSSVSTIEENTVVNHSDRNTFPTREHAEAVLAEAQLMWLRDHYRGGWKPEIGVLTNAVRFGLIGDVVQIHISYLRFHLDETDLFAFQDEATAERFLNEQRPLLKTYFKKFSL